MKISYKSRIKNISNNETEIRNLLKNYNNFKTRLNEKRKSKINDKIDNVKNNYHSQQNNQICNLI